MMRHIFLVPTLLLAAMPAWAGTIDDIVAGVSQSQYTTYLGSLFTGTGQSRDLDGAEHDLARDYIFSNFTSLGLTASLDPFTYGGGTYHNVVGVRTGTVRPEEIYIVGAHYDSRGGPGADDNASGVAGVLEAARVLSGYSFASTLVFVAFDREEQGLIGSYHYAQAASATGQNIRGMLSLDMIAYNPAGATYNTAYVMSGPDSVALGGDIAAAVTAYSGGLTRGRRIDHRRQRPVALRRLRLPGRGSDRAKLRCQPELPPEHRFRGYGGVHRLCVRHRHDPVGGRLAGGFGGAGPRAAALGRGGADGGMDGLAPQAARGGTPWDFLISSASSLSTSSSGRSRRRAFSPSAIPCATWRSRTGRN